MNLTTLREFEAEIKKHVPSMKIAFKDEVRWMKAVGFLVAAFNPDFQSRWSTTIGNTVYFPSKASYEATPRASFAILAHEFVHLTDRQKNPVWFNVSYLLPQLLAPVVLTAYGLLGWKSGISLFLVVLGFLLGCLAAKKSTAFFIVVFALAFVGAAVWAILMTGWSSIIFFLGMALFAPFPSPWRTEWEVRGYTMNLATLGWTYGAPPSVVQQMLLPNFTGPAYYYMSWSSSKVMSMLDARMKDALSGKVLEEPVFRVVHDFLVAKNEARV